MNKLKIYKGILVLLIIAALIIAILVAKKYIEIYKNESALKETISIINEQTENSNEIINKIDAEIKGNKVIGIIKIPKVNIEYPILEITNRETLNLSITKFWGNEINQIGNITLAGHNNLNGTMFGKLKKLQEGDIVELTDIQNVMLQYKIYKVYVTDPNDISCIKSEQEDTREVTLITCSNGNKNRLIVKSREIKK